MFALVVQIHRAGASKADSCAFRASPVQIGRSPNNDLWLSEEFVSRQHAVIDFAGERTTYTDLDARNPSAIDGRRISPFVEVVVDSQSDVRIGPLRLHLHREPAGQVEPALFGKARNSAFLPTRVGAPRGSALDTLFLPPATELAEAPALPSVAAALGALRGAARSGDPLLEGYRAYRRAASEFLEGVRADLEARPPEERERHVLALQRRFPELAAEAEFRRSVAELGIEPRRVGLLDLEDWLKRLTESVFPPRGAPINLAMALERIGELLEVFCAAFVDARVAHEEFAQMFGVERPSSSSVLERIEDGHGVLAYLLNPNREGGERSAELARSLAEYRLQQLASVHATMEGARALLDSFSPEALVHAADAPDDPFARLWPGAVKRLWRKFLARHRELSQPERFERELFGPAFTRRFYAITGPKR